MALGCIVRSRRRQKPVDSNGLLRPPEYHRRRHSREHPARLRSANGRSKKEKEKEINERESDEGEGDWLFHGEEGRQPLETKMDTGGLGRMGCETAKDTTGDTNGRKTDR